MIQATGTPGPARRTSCRWPSWRRGGCAEPCGSRRKELVLDANSYDYLRLRAYLVQDTELGEKGTVTELQAVLDRGVVDSRDETPAR
ncbi:hypothetical protein [Streptomyces sp. LN549]|uniref:hypothetical protein n=1 Tax=Streptomyces sp. LN549 TaxID=3112979 RepID=UPI003723D224